ncbi:polysaccharide biosynthesis protein [Evansella sp. LMS18]|uniref:polysaccharide biosynthesis protein n=1 Tax=Evansella sp. LMS18 TaxID=2924033 RepID=UPI0020D07154|nr:nucleoside-diphosphate sugar epimerase/dehydratase [Evansella sp. LMS18]UTR10586.1 polysaccharide biosynthesis protein [Evansella sp. LMS18]
MSYYQKASLLVFIDSFLIIATIVLGSLLINEALILNPVLLFTAATLLISHYFFSYYFKLYKKAWEYASIGELLLILKITFLSVLLAAAVQFLFTGSVYVRFFAAVWLLYVVFLGGGRFSWRVFRDTYIKKDTGKKRTLIIGAGAAGTMVARQLLNNHEAELLPAAFIDDDKKKLHLDILGVPVVGGIKDIETTVKRMNIENIIIAIPSLDKKSLNTIFQECAKTDADTKILPMLEDIVTGKISISEFREVQVEDLLGREPVKLDTKGISDYITGKVVLVTGAGGSIGSEICRQAAAFEPAKLILLGHGENSIYTVEMELKEVFKESNVEFIPVIADIQDYNKLLRIMEEHKPDVIYHAAAHKHVPLMEKSPEEAVKNNIIGTMNTAKAADVNGISTFVMISSDKAVNPTSVMGATKRLAEMIVQDMDKKSSTKFIAVRFGNVLGSRGSVIPLFKKQIQKGGPVTVTHPDMVRYFMTIPEASRLVIQAGSLAKGGEVFVLDMGDPVKIVDLARNLIKLSSNTMEEIEIEFTGIRPGEKLYEELLNKNEVHEQQIYPNIYVGKTSAVYIEEIENIMLRYPSLTKEELRSELVGLANRESSAEKVLISMPG